MRSSLLVLALLLGAGCDDSGTTGNRKPSPPRVDGPDTAYLGSPAEFEVEAYDPDGDRLVVFVAWGDGDTNDYGDFVESGRTVLLTHSWSRTGSFDVRARCYDVEPLLSEWSAAHPVMILPRRDTP